MKAGFTLRDYQEEAVEKALWSLKKFDDNSLLVLPTASGKSLVSAGIAERLNEEILILQPSKEILEQNVAKMRMYVPDDEIGIFSASLKKKEISKYTFATIQSAYRKPELFSHIQTILFDEADLIDPKRNAGMFKSFFNAIGKPKTIGLTATPYRNVPSYYKEYGRKKYALMLKLINRMNPRLWNRIAYNINSEELYEKGYLCPIQYVNRSVIPHGRIPLNKSCTDYDLLKYEKMTAPHETHIITSIKKAKEHCKSILVFCTSIEKAILYSKLVSDSAYITGETPLLERTQILEDFKAGKIKVVFNMGVLTVGFDHPELDCIYILRPTKSLRLWTQMCLDEHTEILTKRGFLKRGEITLTDEVATLNLDNNKGEWKPVLNITDRFTENTESFVTFSNSHIDFRVTNHHDMIVKARRANSWKKKKAETLFNYKDMYCLPSNVQFDVPDSGLTEWELKFLGLFLSDGSLHKSNNVITISQSITSSSLKEMELILKNCGFHVRKDTVKRKGKLSSYSDLVHLKVSYTTKQGKGWKSLAPYINKQLNENYEQFSRQDVIHLLRGLYLGDGSKLREKTGKTVQIALGNNKQYADALQSLFVRRGFRFSISDVPPPKFDPKKLINQKQTQYIGYIYNKEYSTIAGFGVKDNLIKVKPAKRARLKREAISVIQKVWCVENENGSIITRRKGKVSVVGNCGRGIRLAAGKTKCYVIDYTSNYEELGAIADVKLVNEGGMWELYANDERMHNKVIHERDL